VLATLLATASAPATLGKAQAQTYPDRTVTIIVPWAPGGSTDILARIVAEHLRQSLKQPVVVENRPGASGNIGSAAVARATPDGYTIRSGR
jgi:tripartite-type tricarboxylate transporter receptor subunit TctC